MLYLHVVRSDLFLSLFIFWFIHHFVVCNSVVINWLGITSQRTEIFFCAETTHMVLYQCVVMC